MVTAFRGLSMCNYLYGSSIKDRKLNETCVQVRLCSKHISIASNMVLSITAKHSEA